MLLKSRMQASSSTLKRPQSYPHALTDLHRPHLAPVPQLDLRWRLWHLLSLCRRPRSWRQRRVSLVYSLSLLWCLVCVVRGSRHGRQLFLLRTTNCSHELALFLHPPGVADSTPRFPADTREQRTPLKSPETARPWKENVHWRSLLFVSSLAPSPSVGNEGSHSSGARVSLQNRERGEPHSADAVCGRYPRREMSWPAKNSPLLNVHGIALSAEPSSAVS